MKLKSVAVAMVPHHLADYQITHFQLRKRNVFGDDVNAVAGRSGQNGRGNGTGLESVLRINHMIKDLTGVAAVNAVIQVVPGLPETHAFSGYGADSDHARSGNESSRLGNNADILRNFGQSGNNGPAELSDVGFAGVVIVNGEAAADIKNTDFDAL